jgi:hypothetical protein
MFSPSIPKYFEGSSRSHHPGPAAARATTVALAAVRRLAG